MLPLLIAGVLKNLNVACIAIGEVKGLAAQLCRTLCSPMGCRPVHGILQPRILQWVAKTHLIGNPLRHVHMGIVFNQMARLGDLKSSFQPFSGVPTPSTTFLIHGHSR